MVAFGLTLMKTFCNFSVLAKYHADLAPDHVFRAVWRQERVGQARVRQACRVRTPGRLRAGQGRELRCGSRGAVVEGTAHSPD